MYGTFHGPKCPYLTYRRSKPYVPCYIECEDHDLDNNDWLGTLYEEKKRWVPCYLKGNFWVGMSTTQRNEGLNAFFDGFINSTTTTLQQFVVQHENALRHKAEKECEADFASLNTTIPCATSPLLNDNISKPTHI